MTDSLLVAVLDPIYELVLITLVLCMAGALVVTLAQLFEARRGERRALGKVAELEERLADHGRRRRRCLAPWSPPVVSVWATVPDPATRTPTVDEVAHEPLVLGSWPFDPPAEPEPSDGTLADFARRWEANAAAALANRRPLGRLTWDQPPTIDPPPEIDDYHQRLAHGPHTAETPAVTQ